MIKDRIAEVRERVAQACRRAGREPGGVTIVAVGKGRPVEDILQAFECGLTQIAENRVQEAASKRPFLRTSNSEFQVHMIGHLQTNKAREAVRLFDLIQSVDSARCAQAVDREAAKINKIQDVLLEIKTSPEATKYGVVPGEAKGVIEEISALKNIRICGLMTIAPVVDNPELARPYFRMLRTLSERLNLRPMTYDLRPVLSMGMTDDFEVAIEEGATMVRIGRGIFD